MRTMKIHLLLPLGILMAGCGGGGGGSSEAFYGGVWDFSGVKLVDDCGTKVPSTTSIELTVNQDGSRVVVNSGVVTLTGETKPEDDGFIVTGSGTTSNGCQSGYAYSFKNASDGTADTGLVLTVQCGLVQCTVGFAGTSVRRTSRSAVTPGSSESELESIGSSLAAHTAEFTGEPAPIDEGAVDADALNAARAALGE